MMEKTLRLNGKAVAFVDWANVYGWEKSLKARIDLAKLYKHITSFTEIEMVHFYFGTDNNKKSIDFIKKAKKIGYQIHTKPVKYIKTKESDGKIVQIRKCDFDIEIVMSVYDSLRNNYNSFIFFSGDGDFEPIYKLLISMRKQVIVIAAKSHIGKEIHSIKNGLLIIPVKCKTYLSGEKKISKVL